MIIHADSHHDLQGLIDTLARSTDDDKILQLAPGTTYASVSIVMPLGGPWRYDRIKIRGQRSKLVGITGGNLIQVGEDVSGNDRITGFEISGCDLHIVGLDVRLAFTDGALIDDCRFFDSPLEALITGGGGTSRNTIVRNCHAFNCGKGFSAGRAAFNLNGMDDRIEYSSADKCGLFAELGGSGTRITHCTMTDSPIKIGSSGYGCSDIEITHSNLERSHIDCCNPIGKMSDIRVVSNTMIDSPFCWCGAADQNAHAIPAGWPFSDRPSLVSDNVFLGRGPAHEAQAIRLTVYDPLLKSGPLWVARNWLACPPEYSIVAQGALSAPVDFIANDFAEQDVGRFFTNVPGGGPIPDTSNCMRFRGNTGPSGAAYMVSPGSVWKGVL